MAEPKKDALKDFADDEISQELQRVPSVTRLLNRKRLGLTDATQTDTIQSKSLENVKFPPLPPGPLGPTPEPPTSISISEQSQAVSMVFAPNQPNPTPPPVPSSAPGLMEASLPPLPAEPPVASQTKPKIKTSERRSVKRAPAQLASWTRDTLKSGTDPMGQALVTLLEKDATSALFLAAQVSGENKMIRFSSSAALANPERSALWTGISWNPQNSPEVWNSFLKEGYIELAPLIVQGQAAKVLTRSAFGLETGEWGLFVRCGATDACRGLMLITSKKSVLNEFKLLQASFVSGIKTKLAA